MLIYPPCNKNKNLNDMNYSEVLRHYYVLAINFEINYI